MRQYLLCFVFTDTATTEIYTLSLHDALPIWITSGSANASPVEGWQRKPTPARAQRSAFPSPSTSVEPRPSSSPASDRKSTRLNSSHTVISYAVFCLKKKKNTQTIISKTIYKD